MSNTIGQLFRLTTFGESHGPGIGGIIDGCPAGFLPDLDAIRRELDRRRPGQSPLVTPRSETDSVEFLSGLYNGRTTGAPIAFLIRNEQQRPEDYDHLATLFRPSHADFTYQTKYGLRDPRGGGRTSARETAARCVAGAIARQILATRGISIRAYTAQIGTIRLEHSYRDYDLSLTDSNPVRCPDRATAARMEALVAQVRDAGDTVGGVAACVATGVPAGLGEPIYNKLHAALGAAMLSINAAKGFDYGLGFDAALLRGSEQNDAFYNDNGRISTRTNHSGGIQGGISNGQDIYFRVAFKAVSTIAMPQQTVDVHGRHVALEAHGRHDPCVLPRAVPVVEAMTAITLLDFMLLAEATVERHGQRGATPKKK